jgi:UDP-N-acetylglucosamine--N-acetylmuramyl-(pentapeptide) pyrophosphoryl-undecaprenol N-acetylglucosamine transferase
LRASLGESAAADDERFVVLEYVDDMGSAICAADLVVGRAGATSIAELTVLGAPCVLVPYPYATDDHQTKNARSMVERGAAVLIRDDELDGQRFGDEVVRLLLDPEQRASMAAASLALGRRDATAGVIRLAREAAGKDHDPQVGDARD